MGNSKLKLHNTCSPASFRQLRNTMLALACAGLGSVLVHVVPSRAELPPLVSTSPVAVAEGAGFDLTQPWFVEVETGDARAFADRLVDGSPRIVAPDRLVVDLSRSVQLRGSAPDKSLASTYLVDHEDAAVHAVLAEAKATFPKPLTAQDLSDFVHAQLQPDLQVSGWLSASSVAKKKRGTCSEAAVLLAALARANGMPARVIAGVAVLLIDPAPVSVGHGWTEIFINGRWQHFDATQIDRQTTVRYLPELVVDEDIGLELRLMGFTQTQGVRSLRVVGNQEEDASE